MSPQVESTTVARPQHPQQATRRLPVGAEYAAGVGTHFRVWAPKRRSVRVVFENDSSPPLPLAPEAEGYFAGLSPTALPGALYRFSLDDGPPLPDPASRFQPDGPHGPSQVVNPAAFDWTDGAWRGIGPVGQVIYEMHVGTFTREGTWAAAAEQLPGLADVGITCLEVMPVNEYAGRFGWGYDGVDLFAPSRNYGTPDDFRSFVDAAHAAGVGVILDVVYNHLGPDGCYHKEFSPDYFTDRHKNDWGESLNFDGDHCGPVRDFFVANAKHWIEEYHLDGFRFDATQAIPDASDEHILTRIVRESREAAGGRQTYYVAENEPQLTRIVRRPERGGYGLDSLWNDDFHHSAMVALSGRHEAYYSDHRGKPQEFISAAKWGYLFQGQRYSWQQARRGTPALDLPPTAFIHFIQNHDQIANSGRGLRAHHLASPGDYRAMTGLLLLMPQTPLLFQGQEFCASADFHYFADHKPDLAKLVREGRKKELTQFPSVATEPMQRLLLDPADRQTFESCKLDHAEKQKPFHARMLLMHRDLLHLRRREPFFRRALRRGDVEGAVIGPGAFVLRYFGDGGPGDDRLLIVNFGADLELSVAPEPLLAPPPDWRWAVLWSSEDPRYGGGGMTAVETENEGWLFPGRCAVYLQPLPAAQATVKTRVKKSGAIKHEPAEGETGG